MLLFSGGLRPHRRGRAGPKLEFCSNVVKLCLEYDKVESELRRIDMKTFGEELVVVTR